MYVMDSMVEKFLKPDVATRFDFKRGHDVPTNLCLTRKIPDDKACQICDLSGEKAALSEYQHLHPESSHCSKSNEKLFYHRESLQRPEAVIVPSDRLALYSSAQ
jgi:hypothetical protein